MTATVAGERLTGRGAFTPAPGLQLQAPAAPSCPAVLAGQVTGSVGMGVTFGLAVPAPIGMVNFTGTVAPDGLSMGGDWGAPDAQPQALGGTWSATRDAPMAPTLPEWGAILMLAALLGGGVLALRRRQLRQAL